MVFFLFFVLCWCLPFSPLLFSLSALIGKEKSYSRDITQTNFQKKNNAEALFDDPTMASSSKLSYNAQPFNPSTASSTQPPMSTPPAMQQQPMPQPTFMAGWNGQHSHQSPSQFAPNPLGRMQNSYNRNTAGPHTGGGFNAHPHSNNNSLAGGGMMGGNNTNNPHHHLHHSSHGPMQQQPHHLNPMNNPMLGQHAPHAGGNLSSHPPHHNHHSNQYRNQQQEHRYPPHNSGGFGPGPMSHHNHHQGGLSGQFGGGYGGQGQSHHHHHQQPHPHAGGPHGNLLQVPSFRGPAPAEPSLPFAIVVLSDGIVEKKKQEVCQNLSNTFSLTWWDMDEKAQPGVHRLQTLRDLLRTIPPQRSAGFVISNVVTTSMHEMFLLADILRQQKVTLNGLVYMDVSGDCQVQNVENRVKQPIGFELFSKYYYNLDIGFHIQESDTKSVQDIVSEIAKQKVVPLAARTSLANEVQPKESVTLFPQVALEAKLDVLLEVQNLLTKKFEEAGKFATPTASIATSKVLDYSSFNRWAHTLRSFFAVPVIDGENALLVVVGQRVYLYFDIIQAVFDVEHTALPAKFVEAVLTTAAAGTSTLQWVFAARLVERRLADSSGSETLLLVTDVLLDATKGFGSALYTSERLAILKQYFADAESNDVTQEAPFAFLPYYPLQEIRKQSSRTRFVCQGFQLVKPTPLAEHQQTFLLATDPHAFDVRLWNGQMKGDEWIFDCYVRSANEDGADAETLLEEKLVVGGDTVSLTCMNNGNIVSCRAVLVTQPAPVVKGGPKQKQAMAAPTTRVQLEYIRRKKYSILPGFAAEAAVCIENVRKPGLDWTPASILTSTQDLSFLATAVPIPEAAAAES